MLERRSQVGYGSAGAATAITSSPGDIHTFLITEKCKLIEFGFTVDTDISTTNPAVLELDRIPLHDGVRTAAKASLTIPTGVVTGDTYWDHPAAQVLLYPGDQMVVQVATSPAVAGSGWPYIITERVPELNANITGLHESA